MANAEALKKIVLKEVVENIDEVIVTGYQRIDRKLFTGAAVVIKAEDAMVEGSIDVSRMLQGKAAGDRFKTCRVRSGHPRRCGSGAPLLFMETRNRCGWWMDWCWKISLRFQQMICHPGIRRL